MPDKLSECFEQFMQNLGGNQSATNRRNYGQRLKLFMEMHGEKRATAVSPADVNLWLEILQSRGLAEATMTGYRQAIKAFFNFCVNEGMMARSPAAHVATGSFSSKRRKVPAEADVDRVTQVAFDWLYSKKKLQIRDGLIFLLAKGSGPRQREIQELRKSEVEAALHAGPDAFGVYQVASIGKTKHVYLRFDGAVANGFVRWLEVRPRKARIDRCFVTHFPTRTSDDPVRRFRPLAKSAIDSVFVRICAAAGLKRPIRSQALRHRLGDLTTRKYGAKVAALLLNHKDWQSAATALTFYHHPEESDISQAIAEVGEGRAQDEIYRLFGVEKG
jgi:site-specific recombinase XerD